LSSSSQYFAVSAASFVSMQPTARHIAGTVPHCCLPYWRHREKAAPQQRLPRTCVRWAGSEALSGPDAALSDSDLDVEAVSVAGGGPNRWCALRFPYTHSRRTRASLYVSDVLCLTDSLQSCAVVGQVRWTRYAVDVSASVTRILNSDDCAVSCM
jgi:hypothetical protein